MNYVLIVINQTRFTLSVKIAILNRFREGFNKWTNGNELVDKFIQNAQLNARNPQELLEWVPYDRLRHIQFLAQGDFSTIYEAIWLDGNIVSWVNENKKWKRYSFSLINKCYVLLFKN